MKIISPSFEDTIPLKYAKAGQNSSPALSWENVPQGTKSFALSVVDKHPVARNFVHWLVIDINPDATSLEEGASGRMPNGAREVKVYTGPNPPSGSHDYEFTLYALKVEALDLPKKVSLDIFAQAIAPHCLAQAKLIGTFTRVKRFPS